MSRSSKTLKKSEVKLDFDAAALGLCPLTKFCTKRLLEIVTLTELSADCLKFLDDLVNEGKKYEHLSSVHFIRFANLAEVASDVLRNEKIKRQIPRFMYETIKYACEDFLEFEHPDSISTETLAFMVKVSLIVKMCGLYFDEMEKIEKRKRLNDELNELIKVQEVEKGKKKGKKDKKGKEKKSGSKSSEKKSNKSAATIRTIPSAPPPSVPALEDYPQLPLEENDIVFDYNVNNHLLVFALVGFKRIELFIELSKLNIRIASIIQISSHDPSLQRTDFIHQIEQLFDDPNRNEYLDTTIWMKFAESRTLDTKNNLERLIYVMKRITFLKRQHLEYVRNVKLYDFGPEPTFKPAACFTKYCKVLSGYPLEMIKVPVILDAIIEQICWEEQGQVYTWTNFSSTQSSSKHLVDKPSYQVHEEDLLQMQLKSYNNAGEAFDTTLKMLKMIKPLQIDANPPPRPKTYFNFGAPDDDTFYPKFDHLFDIFHLIYFNYCAQRQTSLPQSCEQFDLLKNIVTYDPVLEYQSNIPKLAGNPTSVGHDEIMRNYHVREDLSESVTLQTIFDAFTHFTHYDKMFCHESNATLLRFHDNLDDYALCTVVWNQSLPSLVCLRDFCMFTLLDERKWVEEHKVIENEQLIQDHFSVKQCQQVYYYEINQTELYNEFAYLFEDPKMADDSSNKPTFDGLIQELQTYPLSSQDLKNYAGEKTNDLCVYDIHPRRVQLTGKTTIFHSVDNLKVTIDTSRFRLQEPRCSVCVDVIGELCFYFYLEDPDLFHAVLNDGTIIALASENCEPTKLGSETEIKNVYLSEASRKWSKTESTPDKVSRTESIESLPDVKIENLPYDEFLQRFHLTKSRIQVKKPEKLQLAQAIRKHARIFRLSTRQRPRTVDPLAKMESNVHRLIKRALFKPVRNLRKYQGYSCVFNAKEKEQVQKYKLSLTFPNGLTIETLPKARNKLHEVCQKSEQSAEKHRTFYQNGTVCIKYKNGASTILKSNGDIIQLTQDVVDVDECDDCPKLLPKIKTEAKSDIKPSRCNDRPVKPRTLEQIHKLFDVGNIPYVRKTIIELNGNKITEFNGEIVEKQAYYAVSEDDYHAQEKYLERDDGLRQLTTLKGRNKIQFPDGTVITSTAKFEKDLVAVEPKMGGWVLISIVYKFEHASYIPILYDCRNLTTFVCLDTMLLKLAPETVYMCKQQVSLELSYDSMFLVKTCKKCEADCFCRVDFSGEYFVNVFDSNGQHLRCDKEGNVKMDVCEARNDGKCCHLKRNQKNRERLFVLNGGGRPFGSLWWTDEQMESRVKQSEYSKGDKLTFHAQTSTYEIHTNVYQDFAERFTTSRAFKTNLALSKYKYRDGYRMREDEQQVLYSTFRVLTLAIDPENFESLMDELSWFLENYKGLPAQFQNGIECTLGYLQEMEAGEKASGGGRSHRGSVGSASSYHLIKQQKLQRSNFEAIVANWRARCEFYKNLIRNRVYPSYFQSRCYRNLIK